MLVLQAVDKIAACNTLAINGADVTAIVTGESFCLLGNQVLKGLDIDRANAVIYDAEIAEGISDLLNGFDVHGGGSWCLWFGF